ncbi:MAG TPA: glycosyltransferase family 4 protein [Gaiellaceae bacterium]|jgi:glycosyltransferase involved in cell wall biosynthesis|nr:glycosyltransferase family 4 protein [Gaiellaceae bacterium]
MATAAPLRVLRVYHAGRDPAHRARERALVAAGAEVTLVVPASWPEEGESILSPEQFRIVELDTARTGDVNRHRYRDPRALAEIVASARPDVVDLHEEPFSAAVRQWLRAVPAKLPVVTYAAQNVDKRLPPPFHWYERAAHRRVAAIYPCSRQAASVARGKGFAGEIAVLPLGYDEALFRAGTQSLADPELVFAFVGRLVPEKGLLDAVRVFARVDARRPARLVVAGTGPAEAAARSLAGSLGVSDRLDLLGRRDRSELAAVFRAAHVVLVPSTPTETWTEQFGRVIVEAQASGAVVAGYDSGSIAEVGGEAALLAPPGDVETLVRRVADLVADEAGYQRRRRGGLELAAGRTWARVAEQQLALYRAVASEPAPRRDLPPSPRRRREVARGEFGPTAATVAGSRPFALPFLRRGGPVPRLLAAGIDAVAEASVRLRRS